jgi:hypothetical protein
MRRWIGATLPLLGLAALATVPNNDDDSVTQALTAPVNDPVARLQKRLDAGEVRLTWGEHGYLESVLNVLGVSHRSQTLVFSKTSFQRDHISPNTPRALYFNDSSYVGWCQGGDVVELAVQDPVWGTIFYTLPQKPAAKPRFIRQTYECLQCHSSSMTENVPGLAVRSVYPMGDGNPDLSEGTYLTTDQSPVAERWGGWYVTGQHGKMQHLGNTIFRRSDYQARREPGKNGNVQDLQRYCDTRPYLTAHSDIVALLVQAHQARVHNLLTRASFLVRDALRDEKQMNAIFQESGRRESTTRRIDSACEPLVQALLFSDSAPLTAPVKGTSGFDAEFSRRGPKDKQGRSLYQLDLTTRLLRYPCSFVVYSESFDGLPPEARARIARRFEEILSGKDHSQPFSHLTPADRKGIREILSETKPGFLTP